MNWPKKGTFTLWPSIIHKNFASHTQSHTLLIVKLFVHETSARICLLNIFTLIAHNFAHSNSWRSRFYAIFPDRICEMCVLKYVRDGWKGIEFLRTCSVFRVPYFGVWSRKWAICVYKLNYRVRCPYKGFDTYVCPSTRFSFIMCVYLHLYWIYTSGRSNASEHTHARIFREREREKTTPQIYMWPKIYKSNNF